MKIKTRLQLSIILSLILTVTIGLFVLFALKKMNTEVKEERTVTEIVKGMAELKSATHEYLLHPTDRSLMQWNSTYDYLTKLVMKNANEFENPAEKIVLGKILKTIKRFKAAFSIVTTGFGKEQGLVRPKSAISPDLRDRLIGELLVKPQATVSPVFQLQRVIQAELMATQKNSALLTIIFILILAFLVTAISLWINRSIARPIAELEKDIRIIGSGNLDHKVGTTAKDEIGQLSRAFDMMTGDLKGTTASIVELNKEIGERKRAEEAFRESEAQKTAILDGISTNLAFVNEDLEILWANKISADSVNRNMDEIIGKKCYELWADPNAPCDDCPTAKAFQTKK
ncbi:MAG: HAMP domain-containing protein, partial [Deltaproteobacteria bacterium]|nr:HAMP domain-containing protein [Deltaproteobacteria bacterium]